ncbi:OsmC family protein [Aureitalea marina]|uniref:Disulfide bond formation regulator n=1 Tax=Aureitalea marina TaxID=930804 RepID=A0A2S7KM21_9FLAO|nr:OsmC family protein [Aureitalea marina]PQB03641.1 disulfide bond formation regulator [Aureitalea marina]
MKVNLERKNDQFLFEAIGATGVPVHIDNKTGDEVHGASPMELVLMGVGGCSAIDVIFILQKQKLVIDDYRIEVEGSRMEVGGAKPFESILVTMYLEGDIPPAKAKRAVGLSFEKYCSVSITLQPRVKIDYRVVLNGELLE